VLKQSWLWLAIAISYTIVLLYVSLSDTQIRLEDDFPHKDKLLHFIAYIGLSVIWSLYFKTIGNNKAIQIGFLATLVFGIVLESIQEWINPSRTFDVLDVLANCLGVLTGTIIVRYFLNSKVKLK